MKKQFALVTALIFLAGCVGPPISLQSFTAPEGFHGVVLVANSRGSKPIIRSYGFANIEAGKAFDEATRSQIGSVSKFLTAILILRLVQKQTLNLDQPILTWLPILKNSDNGRVTLRQLMSNASGIPNGVMTSYRIDPILTSQEISALEASKRWGTEKLAFKPGSDWNYSLTNWVIVRAIIESATERSFESNIQEELVSVLGLTSTGVPGPSFPQSSDFAQNYIPPHLSMSKLNSVPTYAAAAGTIYSSALDLRKILDAVFDGRFLGNESVIQLTSVNFEEEGYALGGRVVDLRDTSYKLLWESGETSNYRALVSYEPTTGACVIFLDNSGANSEAIGEAARSTMRQILKQR